MGKNKNNVKRVKKEIQYRTKEQRQEQVKEILLKLTNFDLNIKYEPVKKLYSLFKEYIQEDRRIEVNIPFPEIKRRIKGLLAISVNEETWVSLQHE
tara:strand:+ start:208 stop:495 length:288 start_codon:yes stop_codon:yes gene_type:complete